MDEINKNNNVAGEPKYHGHFYKMHNDGRSNNYTNKRPEYYNRPNYRYFNNAEYGTNRLGFVGNSNSSSDRNYRRSKEKQHQRKDRKRSRPNSPDEGSEEYMNKKIQQTSAIIMRHLLSPEETFIPQKNSNNKSVTAEEALLDDTEVTRKSKNKKKRTENSGEPECSYSHKHKKKSSYDVEKIHDKIMSHLSNLNDGRKKNLISNTTSVYDDAINNIVKQKRLEISRALRSVYLKSSDVSESSEWINSIIPDMGIKIEDLPVEVLQELQQSFSNFENIEDLANLSCYSVETVPNTPYEDRCEVIDDNIIANHTNVNVIPPIAEEVVEILKSDILIVTPGGSSTPAYLNYTDETAEFSSANIENSVNLNKATCPVDESSMRTHLIPEKSINQTLELGTTVRDDEIQIIEDNVNADVLSELDAASSGICPSQSEAGICSTGFDVGTCSAEVDVGTCSSGLDAGTSSIWLDSGQRAEQHEAANSSSQFEIEIHSSSEDSSDDLNADSPNQPNVNNKTIQLEKDILKLLKKTFKHGPTTYFQAIKRMFVIDKCIAQLTEYRQALFTCVKKKKRKRAKKAKKEKKTAPLKISQPTGNARLTENAQRTKNTQPTENAQRTENTQPAENAQPTEFAQQTNKTQQTNKALAVKKGKTAPLKISQPTGNARLTENAQRTKTTQPTENAQRMENTQPAENAQPTEFAQQTNKALAVKKGKKVKNAKAPIGTKTAVITMNQNKSKEKKLKTVKNKKNIDIDVIPTVLTSTSGQSSQEVQIPLHSLRKESQVIDEVRVKEEPVSADFDMVDIIPKESIESKDSFFEFNDLKEKVLVLKVCKDKLLAATESGKIYFFNITTGTKEEYLQVTTLPLTSLAFKEIEDSKPYLFVGSCESSLKVYNLYSTCLLHSFFLDDSVQCMDENWGYLFLGCLRGTIFRYSIKKEQIEYEEQFSSDPVFVLKATVEGARKVLLIGSRDSPVIVRDAVSGLLLRKLKIMYPTVYSMIMHKHYVICGTKAFDVLLFNFHNGNLEHTFKATTAKGVACMKVVGKCLFASCYNGKIYVFNLETKTLVDTMSGPGGIIISMEVLTNQVIVGTLSCKISSIPITHSVLSQMG